MLAGCVQKGAPLVTERSPDFDKQDVVVERPPNIGKPAQSPPLRDSSIPATRETRARALAHGKEHAEEKQPLTASVRRPSQYLVRSGDTLYAIAWRFELDHLRLAQANGIPRPFVIQPGQVIELREAAARASTRAAPTDRQVSSLGNVTTSPVKKPAAKATQRVSRTDTPPKPVVAKSSGGTKGWVWPVAGKPQREFSRTSKGMDFTMSRGAGVSAIGAGEIAYAGNGIGGFERLVIVRHAGNLLSAYSFNGAIAVKEAQGVKAGQKVADITNNGPASQKLHFELRKDGTPINPRSILQGRR